MTMKKQVKTKLSHRMAAAVATGAVLGASSTAHAGAAGGTATSADFQTLTNSVSTATNNFTVLMTMLGYIGGAGFAIAGIYKLKAHVDNPGNAPLKDGLMRLAAGGALLSLPLMIRTIQGSISNGNNQGATVAAMTQFNATGGAGGAAAP